MTGRWLCSRCQVTWYGLQLCWCCESGAYSARSVEIIVNAQEYRGAA